MCMACSDYVASCWVCTQPMRGSPDRRTGKQFYLDFTKFCEHFIERYHTDSPSMYEHVRTEHCMEDDDLKEYWDYTCINDCISNNWYPEENLRVVVDAFNEWGEQY